MYKWKFVDFLYQNIILRGQKNSSQSKIVFISPLQLPVITDLRNPFLKPRHWLMLEQIVGATLVDMENPLTLERLIEINAFEYAQDIQDVSGQASGEASLETILKKVYFTTYTCF